MHQLIVQIQDSMIHYQDQLGILITLSMVILIYLMIQYVVYLFNFKCQWRYIYLFELQIREYFAESLCKSCDKINQGCDYNTYRQNLVYAINYFINGVDEKNAQYINALTNPQASGLFNSTINIIPQYKSNGYNVLQTGPFCTHE